MGNNVIAAVGFQYDQTEYKQFEKIYWRLTQKKSYVKFQLITLAMLIIPGIYFAIFYWIFIKSNVRKTCKIIFEDHKEGIFQNLSFASDGFNVKTEFYNEDYKYEDFKIIVNSRGFLAFYHKNVGGYCVPTKLIEKFDELQKVLAKLPNYIEVNK